MKGMEIKQNILNFQDLKLAVHSKACISKKNKHALPYTNYGFKCFGIYFWSEKEM